MAGQGQYAIDDLRGYDPLSSLILSALQSLFNVRALKNTVDSVLQCVDDLFMEHHIIGSTSQLKRACPSVAPFWTPLPFREAFNIYNSKYHLTDRQFVPPAPEEVRHVLNLAQVVATSCEKSLKLISFDGDGTLYADGADFDDAELTSLIAGMMQRGINVALVTAAGYEYQIEKYERRLAGLLAGLKEDPHLAKSDCGRFMVFGGESNYLLSRSPAGHLEPVDERLWEMHHEVMTRPGFLEESTEFLDLVESTLSTLVTDLGLRCSILRKKRACGLVPGGAAGRHRHPDGSGAQAIKFEILEEAVLRVRHAVEQSNLTLSYCAFNGGKDVWVDIGNKAVGIKVLQRFLGIHEWNCLHIGDQFRSTGNDLNARQCSPTIAVVNPEETKAVLRALTRQLSGVMQYSLCTTNALARYMALNNMKENVSGSVKARLDFADNSPTELQRRESQMLEALSEVLSDLEVTSDTGKTNYDADDEKDRHVPNNYRKSQFDNAGSDDRQSI